jgi:hypothetical protein
MWRKRDFWTKAALNRIAATFDEPWYSVMYRRDLEAHKKPEETPLDFYLRMGARIGHDPHATFSELYFRTANPRVFKHLLRHPKYFGYLLFLAGFREGKNGEEEPRTLRPLECENWRALTTALDREFIAANYVIDRKKYVSELDFYILCSRTQPISPSAAFSEERYRGMHADVEKDIREGRLISGYHQFVVLQIEQGKVADQLEGVDSDNAEMKRRLEETIPGITRPIEFDVISELEYLTLPITIKRTGRRSQGFLIFIPYYIPELFFGGYHGFFELLRTLKHQNDADLKLVIVRKMPWDGDLEVNIKRIDQHMPEIAGIFSSYHLLQESRTIGVDGEYGVISFCAETHFVASDAARQLDVTPYFHVPDYEPDFNSAGSVSTFVRSAYDLPHRGLYNSRKLYEYFRDVASIEQTRDPGYRYVTFENSIKPMPWDRKTFRERHIGEERKRLIIYARPEPVGTRNDFALIIVALKRALQRGYFDESRWSFHGIGAMSAHPQVELSRQSSMEVIPKLPLLEYEEFLLQGDIGISVISTPHPGIIHFQMAAFGLTTITYAIEGRSPEWLKSQSKNIIPCRPSIDGLCEAIAQAVENSDDIDARYENAIRSHIPPYEAELKAAARFCAMK